MEPLFLTCAILGGTVMVAQFLLTVMGHGGGDVDHDFSADAGHSIADSAVGHAMDHADSDHHDAHSSTWFFGIITFRTVVAALTFFGLAGMAALSAEFEPPIAFLIALAAGFAAMYGVHSMMRMLYRLRADGTQRIHRAIGCEATVYLPIPAHGKGAGKVHLTMQNRLMEFEAITSGERVPSGIRVVVTEIAGPSTLRVEPAPEMARNQ